MPGCGRPPREEDHGGFRSARRFPNWFRLQYNLGLAFTYIQTVIGAIYVERRIFGSGSRGVHGRAGAVFYLIDPEAMDFSVDFVRFPYSKCWYTLSLLP